MTNRFGRAVGCPLLALLVVAIGWAAASPVRAPARAASARARLGLIVAPARIRPGRSAIVRIADGRRAGAISGRLCARLAARRRVCRDVHLPAGEATLRTHVVLRRAGRWTITLRPAGRGRVLKRTVEVAAGARQRVLVAGDSMIRGIAGALARRVRRGGGAVRGDERPGSGISKPVPLSWPAHARELARRYRPDATVMFLGAVDGLPLRLRSREIVECCGPAWIAEYARLVRAMMATYLRDGSALVYWLRLPASRDDARAPSHLAINAAIAQAAATFADGVRIVDADGVISPGDVYRETATYRGRRRVIRARDGLHLAGAGIELVADVIAQALRRDEIVR
jgi:hypothetical protein